MKTDIAKILHSDKLDILQILLRNSGIHLDLLCKARIKDNVFDINFFNVSNITMKVLSSSFEIWGFEIIDHKKDGWLKEMRYEMNDYESDCLHFFCESFEIIPTPSEDIGG